MSSRRSRRTSSRIASSESAGARRGVGTVRLTVMAHRPPPAAACALHLLDQLQLLGQAAEVATAILFDHDQVLDPNAELARQADAGLDRHHLTHPQRVLRARRDVRRLVHLEPDAVAEPVAEALAVPGGLD